MPWPISVHEWKSEIVPSASGRRIDPPALDHAVADAGVLQPQAIPANRASR